uniref:D(1B) dopamine receptor n=1 Tax=Euleptes europaea TaxID=460621 RepID=UPI00254169E1|nr:D(1B) dopamine receptor [Euleptes europaea]
MAMRMLTASALSLLVAWTLLGNGLVCAALVGCRRLRARVSSVFLASLAVSDLLVALLVMPWKAAAEVAGHWPFGAFCRVWVAFDILCSTASILSLCAIALDRCWAVCSPFGYERRMTPRRALAAAALAWALALAVSFLPVQLDWHRRPDAAAPRDGSAPPPARRCDARLNRAYALSSSLVSFYIPGAVMLVAYGRIYRVARGQIRRISSLERAAERARRCRGGPRTPTAPPRAAPRHEARVLRTLALLVGVFVGCWLPFFVLNCLAPFCPPGRDGAGPPCVSDATFDVFAWVGWANSSLNPLIYACNADFRKVFSGLLGCGHRGPSAPRETANLTRELLSCRHDPLPPPRRLPSACPAGSPHTPAPLPCPGTGPQSPEPTDCQLDLSLGAPSPCTPQGLC